MCLKSVKPELKTCSSTLQKTKRIRLLFLKFYFAFVVFKTPTATPFVIQSRNYRIGELASKQQQQEEKEGEKIFDSNIVNGDYKNESDNLNGYNNNGKYKNGDVYADSNEMWQQNNQNTNLSNPDSQSPVLAISIVSELKANAALFAAFAYGSLNLPPTLTVSESKVTSVTTSLSISRPLPDSDLIRAFVVLDVCTLCLMISCVAASQLLIYRITDGSYEEIVVPYNSNELNAQKRKNSRDSALGRLSTVYRNEFTVARITFDLGLITLLLSVGVRSLAIYDEKIFAPVVMVIGMTSAFLALAKFKTYVEVFRTAENIGDVDTNKVNDRNNLSLMFLPILLSIGLGLYYSLSFDGIGPYYNSSAETMLKVVTEKLK